MPSSTKRRGGNSNSNQHNALRLVGLLVALSVVLFPLKVSRNTILQSSAYYAETFFSPSSFLNSIGGSDTTDNTQAARRAELVTESHKVVEHLQQLQQQQQSDSASTADNNNNNKKKKPLNILLLYPDDWRHDSIGGVAPVVQTPFLNQLAREGIRFTHNMVTTSICWISRATLFTGQYASRHKSYRLRTPVFYDHWHNASWPALLQQHPTHPYYTGHVGKWQYANPDRIVQTKLFNYTSIFEGRHSYTEQGKTISAAHKTYQEVKSFLDARPTNQPFALTAAFYPPKAIGNSFEPGGQWFPQTQTLEQYYNNQTTVSIPRPYNETDAYQRLPWFFHKLERGGRSRWEERFQNDTQYQTAMRHYYALVTEVDAACRDIVQELKHQNILDETMIIFTTDNGMFLGEHGLAGKWYPYQESIRVPLIVRDPRMPLEKQGTLDDSLTLNIDLLSTILGAAGLETPSTAQGRDIADLYLPPVRSKMSPTIGTSIEEDNHQQQLWRTEFFYEFPLDMGKTMPMSTAVVRKDMKYIQWPQFRNYTQLFNLTEDPLELTDVWGDPRYTTVLNELRNRHSAWMKKIQQ